MSLLIFIVICLDIIHMKLYLEIYLKNGAITLPAREIIF